MRRSVAAMALHCASRDTPCYILQSDAVGWVLAQKYSTVMQSMAAGSRLLKVRLCYADKCI